MSCIACLTSLTSLALSRTYCSDSLAFNASLAGLASLDRLRHLDLSHTDVDGSGLANFCSSLQVCGLGHSYCYCKIACCMCITMLHCWKACCVPRSAALFLSRMDAE